MDANIGVKIMCEAKTVLYKRKNELETEIRRRREKEDDLLKQLKATRDARMYRERLLQEVMDVYSSILG